MVLFVLIVNQLLGRPWIESLLFAVALAVGLSPELLPAIMSVTLSAGARAHGRRRRHRAPPRGDREPRQHGRAVHRQDRHADRGRRCRCRPPPRRTARAAAEVLRLAYLNAAFETGIDNPLDAAIVAAGERAGPVHRRRAQGRRDPLRLPAQAADHRGRARGAADRHLIITKGAFGNVLRGLHAGASATAGAVRAGRRRARAAARPGSRAQGATGPARCWRWPRATSTAQAAYSRGRRGRHVPRGFLLFVDPPKAEASAHAAASWPRSASASRSSPATTATWPRTWRAASAWTPRRCSPASRSTR